MSDRSLIQKIYRWEYRNRGSLVLCHDTTYPDGVCIAMCACATTAEIICEALNKTRKSENRL